MKIIKLSSSFSLLILLLPFSLFTSLYPQVVLAQDNGPTISTFIHYVGKESADWVADPQIYELYKETTNPPTEWIKKQQMKNWGAHFHPIQSLEEEQFSTLSFKTLKKILKSQPEKLQESEDGVIIIARPFPATKWWENTPYQRELWEKWKSNPKNVARENQFQIHSGRFAISNQPWHSAFYDDFRIVGIKTAKKELFVLNPSLLQEAKAFIPKNLIPGRPFWKNFGKPKMITTFRDQLPEIINPVEDEEFEEELAKPQTTSFLTSLKNGVNSIFDKMKPRSNNALVIKEATPIPERPKTQDEKDLEEFEKQFCQQPKEPSMMEKLQMNVVGAFNKAKNTVSKKSAQEANKEFYLQRRLKKLGVTKEEYQAKMADQEDKVAGNFQDNVQDTLKRLKEKEDDRRQGKNKTHPRNAVEELFQDVDETFENLGKALE